MQTLASLKKPISSLIVSPDGSTVIVASGEDVGFLDLASSKLTLRSLQANVCRLAWGSNGVLAGTNSGEIWSVGEQSALLLEAIEEEVSGIAVARDGSIAVCGGEPNAVALFDGDGEERWSVEPYKWAYCVRFSQSGDSLLIATWDGALHVLDVSALPARLPQGTEYAGGPLFDAQFLASGDVVVAGAQFVRMWDRETGRYKKPRALDTEALAIVVSPDGRYAIASTNDQQLRRYRLPSLAESGRVTLGRGSDRELSSFPDYAEFMSIKGEATVRSLAFHPDGERVFGATEDGRVLEVRCAEFDGLAKSAKPAKSAKRAKPAKTAKTAKPARSLKPKARKKRG